jgi:hypothetical protein
MTYDGNYFEVGITVYYLYLVLLFIFRNYRYLIVPPHRHHIWAVVKSESNNLFGSNGIDEWLC